MYQNPFELGDRLFAIDKEGVRDERDLDFAFDPAVDYFASVDAMMPPWRPPSYATLPGSVAALTASAGLQEHRTGRVVKIVSRRRYVRAIDPAGRLRQLKVSTVPTTPSHPDGNDRIGTMQRVVAEKSQRGWLIVERDPATWSPYSGRRGQEYCAWALAVGEWRRKVHEEHEKEEAKAFMSQATREANKRAEEQTAALRELAQSVVTATAASTAAAAAREPRRSGRGDG